MLKIIAFMVYLVPGMDAPKTVETPVATYEECQTEIGKMIEAVKLQSSKDFRVLLACEVTSVKSDPA